MAHKEGCVCVVPMRMGVAPNKGHCGGRGQPIGLDGGRGPTEGRCGGRGS